jgi:tyrosinase
MLVRHPTRRELLGTMCLGAYSTVTGGISFSSDDDKKTRYRVRKDVTKLSQKELDVYSNAVQAMKDLTAKNANDPLGWREQAKIHRDKCPHGNWFFLPWHRAYLHYFEAICRKLTGVHDFALPYWDWTKDRKIPAAFFNKKSPLFDPTRKPDGSTDDEFVGSKVVASIVKKGGAFTTFAGGVATSLRPPKWVGGGQLEHKPHDYIHNYVDGSMATFMSPLDPIFWLHHANVDRLWTEWEKNNAGVTTNDKRWLSMPLEFTGADGKTATKFVWETLNTYDLGYRYDSQAGRPMVRATPVNLPLVARNDYQATATNTAALTSKTPTVVIPVKTGKRLQVNLGFVAKAKEEAAAGSNVQLAIEDISVPRPTAFVRVFVNCPKLTPNTPITDSHYVSSFAFFAHQGKGMEGHEGETATTSVLLDLTDTLRRLNKEGTYDPTKDLEVQLVLRPRREGETPAQVLPKQIRLSYLPGTEI